MNRTGDEAAQLDSFFDDLARDMAAAPPAGLDPGLAQVARTAAANERNLAGAALPGPDRQAHIWQQALAAHRRAALPAPRGLRWPHLTLATTRWRLAGGAILALLVLAGLALLGRAPSVSAAEILARAAHVADDASAFGLHSYAGTIEGHSRGVGAPQIAATWHEQVWFQAPGSRRIELRAAVVFPPPALGTPDPDPTPLPAPTGGTVSGTADVWIWVTDGTTGWEYQPARHLVLQKDPAIGTLSAPAFGATNLQELVRNAGRDNSAQFAGTTTIAGRPTYVLDLTPKPEAHVPLAPGVTQMRDWVDQQTYLLLGSEGRDAAGQVLTTWAFTHLDLNPALDAGLFRFTPPPDAQVIDARPRATPTAAEQTATWQRLAARVPFAVFQPTGLPAWLTPAAGPPADPGSSGVIVQNYDSPRTRSALILAEAPTFALGPVGGGDAVSVGDLPGRYQEQNGTRWLVFTRDGTRLSLQGESDVTREVLLAVAGSLQPVPPLPPRR